MPFAPVCGRRAGSALESSTPTLAELAVSIVVHVRTSIDGAPRTDAECGSTINILAEKF